MANDLIGTYRELPFPPPREVGIDTVRIGMARHHIPVLAEVDVTLARAAIAKRKAETGEGLSFTDWVIKCLAQAASEHKRVHALRLGRHKLVVFDDVDVNIVVQRRIEGTEPPEYLPMPYVIRNANEKTVEAIHAEIRAAQARVLAPGEQTIDLAEKMPSPRTTVSPSRTPIRGPGPDRGRAPAPIRCARRCASEPNAISGTPQATDEGGTPAPAARRTRPRTSRGSPACPPP